MSDWDQQEEDRKFRWLNLPSRCKYKDDGHGKITANIPKKTDLWRLTRHGYVKENAPYYFRKVTGDFQVTVKVTADFLDLYDQAGILIRQNKKTYMKCGIEVFLKNRQLICHASTAVTKESTDWSTMPLPGEGTKSYWFVVRRIGNCVEAYCSADGITYNQIRLAQLTDQERLSVGMYGACPQGSGLKVIFEHFDIQESESTDGESDYGNGPDGNGGGPLELPDLSDGSGDGPSIFEDDEDDEYLFD